ncbi:monooxygenase [Streptomyces filipinensis]|uniref:Monooxygenase n=1 Tax=Streptomyces filipinensis TaxID=66887 RepID=A0A918IAN2_9ACTN|nr:LLM class flavin-dependent oxidoreductase [Streptomyces filipinensis]GGU94321.1 monooxygenase [Streptomyces filipinensis]
MSARYGRGLLCLAAAVDLPGCFDAGPYVELVRLAERGGLDFVTLDDSSTRPGPAALAVLSRAAPATRRIGLVPTVVTAPTGPNAPTAPPGPFRAQAAVATLDWVSRGRAGWRIEVSAGEDEARPFGRRRTAPAAALGDEAGEVTEAPTAVTAVTAVTEATDVTVKPRDGRADGAGSRDVPAVRLLDRDRPHRADFTGGDLLAGGASTVPRPPHGHPVRVVDATGSRARTVAARHADVALIRAATPAHAAAVRDELRTRAAACGRDPDTLRTLVSLLIDLGDGEYAAEPGHGGGGPRPTARGPLYRGGPVDLAELVAGWYADGVTDGFHLRPVEPRRDLERLVNGTVALLQHRGLFRTFYPGGTLREHLGLARPTKGTDG